MQSGFTTGLISVIAACGPLIEGLLAERGITVGREAIRLGCTKSGALFARRLKRKQRGYGDTLYIDEVCIKINDKQHYLWRAVDQDGEVVDVYLQATVAKPQRRTSEDSNRQAAQL